MKNTCRNIYATARIEAGFTQEHAAELLNVSIRSLAEYESGKRIPQDDIVCSMIENYRSLTLAYLHLKNSTEVGRKYLPDIHTADLAQSVLRLHKEVDDLKHVTPDMFEIACDGSIEDHESKRWSDVTKEVKDIAGAALSMLVFQPISKGLIANAYAK